MADSPLLTREGVEQVQAALADMRLHGWLLFEFHGQNPIAASMVGLGWNTRRSFTLVPDRGDPVALIHAIEGSSWRHWPWRKRVYSSWREMESALADLVRGRPRLAVETSPGSAIPYLDRVPGGMMELLRAVGVDPVSSGDLVSLFHSRWTAGQLATHRRSAAVTARVAREAFERAAAAVEAGEPTTEGALSDWIRARLNAGGLAEEVDCIVAIGPRAADPHYAPVGEGEPIRRGDLLLIDLWGKPTAEDIPADQTWMGYLGARLPRRTRRIWEAVRDARDAAVEFLRERTAAGDEVCGYEVDDVCRQLIRKRGYGRHFVHRTGHSIDVDLHGSGPNIDNLETRDTRLLLPGVGFSIEPGIYIPDDIGVRSEVDVHLGEDGPEVTTPDPQEEVFLLSGARG